MKIYIRASEDITNWDEAFSADASTRRAIARTTNSPEILEVFAYDPDLGVRRNAFANPQMPVDILSEFASSSDDEYVLHSVMHNPSLPHDMALDLADRLPSTYSWLTDSMMHKYKNDREVLDKLIPKAPRWTLAWLGGLVKTPVDILETLAQHPDALVRSGLLKNRRLPDHIFAELLADPELGVDVVKYLKKNPSRLTPELVSSLADSDNKKVRSLVCELPEQYIPKDVQVKLSKDRLGDVRSLAAFNFNLPESDFARLATDRSKRVRRCVAGNPNTPTAVLRTLVTDPDSYVQRNLLYYHSELPRDIIEMLADAPGQFIRSRVAEHPSTPDDIVRQLAQDPDSSYVATVARQALLKRGLISREEYMEEFYR